MKRNHDIPFLEDLQTAPRVSWGLRPKPASRATEKELGKWFVIGIVLGFILACLLFLMLGVNP